MADFDYSWLWSWIPGASTVAEAVKAVVTSFTRVWQEWAEWLFSVERVKDLGDWLVTHLWQLAENLLPDEATSALNQFFTMWSGAQFSKLIGCVLWGLDQIFYVNVLLAVFGMVLLLVPGFLILRWMVWGVHQVWGTGDGE